MSDDPLLEVAQDLRAIVDMHADLPGQAAAKSTARLMPGGLAMVALGPVANLAAVEGRRETLERLWWENDEAGERPDFAEENDDPWEPPLQTLRFWSEEYRRMFNADVDRWTVQTEAAFLLDRLGWAVKYEPHWNDFCRDVRAARRRLEDVLHDGEREERSKVPCIDCDEDRSAKPITVRLVLHYAPTGTIWCEPCKTTWHEDHWICPRCKRQYDEDAMRLAEHHDLLRRGLDRWVSVYVAADALQVPPHIVRAKANACDLATRSLIVWWPDIRDVKTELEASA